MQLDETDRFHLEAAQAWLALRNHSEANAELEEITPRFRAHPDVLCLRCEIYGRAGKWEFAAEIARTISVMLPDHSFGPLRLAYALHELKRTREAWDTLLPVADKFPELWLIPYNLACYAAQLGWIKDSEKWFKAAMTIDEQAVKHAAIEDPDLEPLWKGMGGTKWRRIR